MPPLRPSSKFFQAANPAKPQSALAARIASLTAKLPFQVTTTCPSPTCACTPTPTGLDIDYKTPISNNIAPYHAHILIATGQNDWPSRIEDSHTTTSPHQQQPWAKFITDIKAAFGRKGSYHSMTRNTLVTASSLPPRSGRRTILHFPSYQELSIPVPPSSTESPVMTAAERGQAAQDKDLAASSEADADLDTLLRYLNQPPSVSSSARNGDAASYPTPPPPPPPTTTTDKAIIETNPIQHPTILICSHNSRDSRCGILGPLLHSEFERHLTDNASDSSHSTSTKFRVASVSHIGGHKWAGNVIIYIPPSWTLSSPASDAPSVPAPSSPLAGLSIWYGRVEPRHVQGIIDETVYGGRVIGELCRGVVDREGNMIRI